MHAQAGSIEAKLKDYISSKMPEAQDLDVTGLSGVAFGASRETFTFDLSWTEADERKSLGLVLRRDPPTGLLDHVTRETEFKILKCLEGTGIPAPRVLYCESDPKALQRPFIIMERIDGLVTQAFQTVGRGNQELREKLATQYVDILARIHNLDWEKHGFGFLGVPAGGTDYARREVTKWESIINDVKTGADPVLTEALIWMKSNLPSCEDVCLVHGDYKMDNVMYKKDEVRAIFDWEMATLGDFHDDLGWVCGGFYEVEGQVCGIMEKDWFIERYQRASGRKVDLDSLRFWQVFSAVKMAAIILTGADRYLSGKARKNTLALLPLLMPKLHKEIIELLEL